jgi:excisionase family DNA binding protein
MMTVMVADAVPPATLAANITTGWMTPEEAAQYLRVETRTILLWTRQGKLKGHLLSGTRRIRWRFLRSDLDAKLTAPSVALSNGRIQ